jgi:hypothetical protein
VKLLTRLDEEEKRRFIDLFPGHVCFCLDDASFATEIQFRDSHNKITF